jgi:hypothetical protein
MEYKPGSAGMVWVVGPCRASDDESVLWLGDGAGEVSIFWTLLIVVCFCNREDPAKLIFESVDGLGGDHAIEVCQFVMEGDQHVIGCIFFRRMPFLSRFPCCQSILVVKWLARE